MHESFLPSLFAPQRRPPVKGVASFRWMALVGGFAVSLSLQGCDQLGIETPKVEAERAAADAKAVGGACRQAMRAIEDCYTLNPKSDKASVYEGWREMDEYMRENKLEGIAPVVPRPSAVKPAPKASSEDDEGDGDAADSEGSGQKGKH